MLVKEYRIPFPATLEDYRIGMLYMISRATEEENSRSPDKKRIDVVKRERYYDQSRGIHGVYTEKVCHVRAFLPNFIKIFVPESKSILVEKAWNGFPHHCLTTYESPYLGSTFHLSVESRYVGNDCGELENALGLSEDELAARQVVRLNIGDDSVLGMTPETDVHKFQSCVADVPVMDREGVWMRGASPVMCCYKVCRLEVSTKGLPGRRVERWGHRHGLQAAFIRYNRQVLCWIDSWLGLSVADVDGLNDGLRESAQTTGIRPRLEAAATTFATEIAAESSAGLAFAFSDETNPFFT